MIETALQVWVWGSLILTMGIPFFMEWEVKHAAGFILFWPLVIPAIAVVGAVELVTNHFRR